MNIINKFTEIPNLSLALGFFDGVHLGHQAVINFAIDFAKKNNIKSAVITFKQHPLCYLKGVKPKYIFQRDYVYKIFEELGVDYVIEPDFSEISKMSPIEYLENVLVKYFSPKAISSGFNHHFGSDKSGNVKLLADCQDKFNYIYFATPPQTLYGDIISSTAIRSFINSGSINIANDMLGRKFNITGRVIEGKKLGRKIGFPTANILYPDNIIEPLSGVYRVKATVNNQVFDGIANYGVKPTVSNDNIKSLEVHILNFSDDIYHKDINIEFIKLLRREIKFQNLQELKEQIQKDINSIF